MGAFLTALSLLALSLSSLANAYPSDIVLSPALRMRRDSPYVNVIPQQNVSLHYQSLNSSYIEAQLEASMKFPSVLLENISSLTKVDCSATGVELTFGNSD